MAETLLPAYMGCDLSLSNALLRHRKRADNMRTFTAHYVVVTSLSHVVVLQARPLFLII